MTKTNDSENYAEILRQLPSIDAILRSETATRLMAAAGADQLTGLARAVTETLRDEILSLKNGNSTGNNNYSKRSLLTEAEKRLENAWRSQQKKKLRRVINATGVIIHTNLGRAPLSEAAKRALVENGPGYCTLEYAVETGGRGRRGGLAEKMLADLTGADDALIVNNCAAAAVLVLTALSNGGEAIVSRGELVEIGGDFRIPDVMTQSGAILREVGTTNRTTVADYERAITENTRLIVKVHPSNYRIIGFTEAPVIADLAELAGANDVLIYEDAGSGALFDLSKYGLQDEPVIKDSVAAGADVITFSGDKLIGGTQSGLIVGRSAIIETLRKHPLYRALRVSKIIYAALEATLDAFLRESAEDEIPVIKMLSLSEAELRKRAENFTGSLLEALGPDRNLDLEVIGGKSVVGGGSAPAAQPKTALVSVRPKHISINKLEEKLRFSDPPIVTRVLEDRVTIDLRTVAPAEESELLEILVSLARAG